MFRMPDHIGEKELGSLFEHGIDPLLQELLIRRETIMFPQLQGEPNTACGEDSPAQTPAGRGKTPRIRNDMAHPTRCAIHLACSRSSGHTHGIDKVEERSLAFGEVAYFRHPVVLLGIDVEVKVVG